MGGFPPKHGWWHQRVSITILKVKSAKFEWMNMGDGDPPRPQHCLYWPGGTTPKPWLLFWLLIFLCISLTGWWFDAPWVVKVHRNIFFVGPWNLQTLVISMGKPSNVLHRFLPAPIKCQSNMMSSLFICPVSDFISKNWMLVKCRRKPLDWQGKSRDFLDIFPLNPKRG